MVAALRAFDRDVQYLQLDGEGHEYRGARLTPDPDRDDAGLLVPHPGKLTPVAGSRDASIACLQAPDPGPAA